MASRFRKPCILDVKVGRRVWDDFAERDKIEREKKKYPPQEILGFRIIGMRVSENVLYQQIDDVFLTLTIFTYSQFEVRIGKGRRENNHWWWGIKGSRRFFNHLIIVALTFHQFQVYQSATNDYVYFSKEFGRSVSVSGALEGE